MRKATRRERTGGAPIFINKIFQILEVHPPWLRTKTTIPLWTGAKMEHSLPFWKWKDSKKRSCLYISDIGTFPHSWDSWTCMISIRSVMRGTWTCSSTDFSEETKGTFHIIEENYSGTSKENVVRQRNNLMDVCPLLNWMLNGNHKL